MRQIDGNGRVMARQYLEWGELCLYILDRVDSIRAEVERVSGGRSPDWVREMMKAYEICAQEIGADDAWTEDGA